MHPLVPIRRDQAWRRSPDARQINPTRPTTTLKPSNYLVSVIEAQILDRTASNLGTGGHHQTGLTPATTMRTPGDPLHSQRRDRERLEQLVAVVLPTGER
jgi:hypothetical protein